MRAHHVGAVQVAPEELRLLRDADASVTVLLPPRENLNGLLFAYSEGELTEAEVYDLVSLHIISRAVTSADIRAADPPGEVVQTLREASQITLTLDGSSSSAAANTTANVSVQSVVEQAQLVLSAPVDVPTTVVVTGADMKTCAPASILHNISALLVPGEVRLPEEAQPRSILQREVSNSGSVGGSGDDDGDDTVVIIAVVVVVMVVAAIVLLAILAVLLRRKRRARAAAGTAAGGIVSPGKTPHPPRLSASSIASTGVTVGKAGSASAVQPSAASFASTAASGARSPARGVPLGSPFFGGMHGGTPTAGGPGTPGTPASPGLSVTPSAGASDAPRRSRASAGSWYLAPTGASPSAYRPYDPADTASTAFTVGATTRNGAADTAGDSAAGSSSGVHAAGVPAASTQHAEQDRVREQLCLQLDSLQDQPLLQRFHLLGPDERRHGSTLPCRL